PIFPAQQTWRPQSIHTIFGVDSLDFFSAQTIIAFVIHHVDGKVLMGIQNQVHICSDKKSRDPKRPRLRITFAYSAAGSSSAAFSSVASTTGSSASSATVSS